MRKILQCWDGEPNAEEMRDETLNKSDLSWWPRDLRENANLIQPTGQYQQPRTCCPRSLFRLTNLIVLLPFSLLIQNAQPPTFRYSSLLLPYPTQQTTTRKPKAARLRPKECSEVSRGLSASKFGSLVFAVSRHIESSGPATTLPPY